MQIGLENIIHSDACHASTSHNEIYLNQFAL